MRWDTKGGVVGKDREIARDRKGQDVPLIHTDNTDPRSEEPDLATEQHRITRIGKGSKNPERIPFKALFTPIKVNPSGRRKNLSRILKAGTPLGLD